MRVTFAVSEEAERLKERTKRFALDVLELIKLLPASEPGPTIRRQLTKAATSVPMNYRAACRARSHAEFTARISVVAEEADESSSITRSPNYPITQFQKSVTSTIVPSSTTLWSAGISM